MLLTGILLQRYLLATAFTFGLLALLGWVAAKVAARRGLTALQAQPAKPGFNSFFRAFFTPSATATPQKITRLSTVVLTAHHQVHKIQDGRRTYLLATGPQGTTVIASNLEAAPELADFATPSSLRQPMRGDLPPEAYIAPRRAPLITPTEDKIPPRRR